MAKSTAVAEAPKTKLSEVLISNLTEVQAGLPEGFNIQRFVNNSIALLNGNEALQEFQRKYPQVARTQIQLGLMQGAYLGLDFMSAEAYLVPYGSTLQFQTSYKGMSKIAKKYSIRPVSDIYANVVREDDLFETEVKDGKQTYIFKPVAFSNKPVIGAFATVTYADGECLIETMSKAELEATRSKSKAAGSMAWKDFTSEMYKKVVIKRLCKRIPIEFATPEATAAYQADEAIETDVKVLVSREIAEKANTEVFDDESVIDVPAVEVPAEPVQDNPFTE